MSGWVTTNVLVGGAKLFTAPASTAMPANTVALDAAWPAGWVYPGATDGGTAFNVAKSTQDRMIDEQSVPVGVDVVSTDISIATTLAEDTIENIKLAYGSGLLTVNAGATPPNKVYTFDDPLDQYAVGFEGINTFGKPRRFYLPIAVAVVGGTPTNYTRVASKRLYAVTFRAICLPTLCSITDVTG